MRTKGKDNDQIEKTNTKRKQYIRKTCEISLMANCWILLRYLEAEGMEKTLAFRQHQIKDLLPIQNAEKVDILFIMMNI